VTRVLRARHILPINHPPIENGWIEVAGGRIVSVGDRSPHGGRIEDLGEVAVLPGLVNAHTHLELSWMAGLVPPAASMAAWIRDLVRVRRVGAPRGVDDEIGAARAAVFAMIAAGTAVVGDISNALITPRLLDEAGLSGVVFHELIGFKVAEATAAVREAHERVASEARHRRLDHPSRPSVSVTISAHAPYSVSPALFREIALRASNSMPLTVHLGESQEEMEFLRTGAGPMRQMLEEMGAWNPEWRVPGCDPVSYLDGLGYLRKGVLVVHGVHLMREALDHLRKIDAVLVTCPRSNEWVGSGPPDLAAFYASGVRVAVGTDSVASSPTLNLFDELAAMRRIAPDVAPARFLESATRVGAAALGCAADHGTIEAGRRSAFAVVDVPAGVRDVEEYLVSGVPADRVRRVDA
jgi:cytosine/adenosine deaminase-related metal-dependent hydrolase